jgi:hypothetical protein
MSYSAVLEIEKMNWKQPLTQVVRQEGTATGLKKKDGADLGTKNSGTTESEQSSYLHV